VGHVIIIGNGISGITAARNIRKLSDKKITVISSETTHFFSRTAIMYIYMGHMKYEHTKPYEDWFWAKNRIDLINDHVEQIDQASKKLKLKSGGHLNYDKLIIATGSKSTRYDWSGQEINGVQSLYSFHDLELMEQNTKNIQKAVIVGGGLIGIEMAEMLLSRNIEVCFLIREKCYWNNILPEEEAKMISKHMREHDIDLREETELKEIIGENQKVKSIITNTEEEIQCQFVGITVGVHPNIDLVKDTSIETNKGILVNEFLQTSDENIYAGGDCVELKNPNEGRNNIDAIWYTGAKMGETIAFNICEKGIKYDPGIWYNSAKFLDIEYQVYGDIKPRIAVNEATLFWQHESWKKSIRINYENDSHKVIGFNLMGIRYRQRVCEKWIAEQRTIEYVLENLGEANFDPEFFEQHEQDILKVFNKQSNEQLLQLKRTRGLSIA